MRGDIADYNKGQLAPPGLKNVKSSIIIIGNLATLTKGQPGPSGLRNAYAARQRKPPSKQMMSVPPADPNCNCGCIVF